jgi:DNA-binding CsgD family transcriptional regulator/tetratricopeptide (TPR) repeat protein
MLDALSINGLKFTPREVDVVSLILGGRSTKSIATLLSISPNTAENHIQNVMKKIEGNSRENIINFFEKSSYLSLLRYHYSHILNQAVFEQTLKKISQLLKPHAPTCQILFDKLPKNELKILDQIQTDLGKCGIANSVKRFNSSEYVPLKNTSMIFVFSKEEIESFPKMIHSWIEKNKPIGKEHKLIGFNLQMDSEDQYNFIQNEYVKGINFNIQDYSLSFFRILEILFPHLDLSHILDDFKKYYVPQQASQANLLEKASGKSSNEEKWGFNIVKNKITKKMLLIGSLLLLCLGLIFIKNKDTFLNKPNLIHSDLPLPIDDFFLKRQDLLAQVDKKLQRHQGIQTVALVGLVGIGGVGKTTLARYYGRSQKKSLVWELNAETKSSLMTSFKNLAYGLAKTKAQKEDLEFIQRIQAPEEKEKQLFYFIRTHLKAYPHWLLIYDNVEDFSEIKDYFPQNSDLWGDGKVLTTTRDSNIQNTSFIRTENVIQMGELTPEEALTLFTKILFSSPLEKLTGEQRKNALNFLRNIPSFPLDVSVAAYYIKNEHLTYEEYVKRITELSHAFEKYQETLLKEVSAYAKTRYGIITISLEKIIQNNPEFKDLLFFVSLLDSQDIPKSLLEFDKDPHKVEQFLRNLKKCGLITNESFTKKTGNIPSFSLHRSTQSIMLSYFVNILTEDEKKRYLDKMTSSALSFYHLFLGKDYVQVIQAIPHFESIVKNLDAIKIPVKLIASYKQTLHWVLGYSYYKCLCNFVLAKAWFYKIYIKGNKDKYLSDSMFASLLKDLGIICSTILDTDEALIYLQQSIDLYSNIPHSQLFIAECLDNIGVTYFRMGKFEKSKFYLEAALQRIAMADNSILRTKEEAEIYARLGGLYSATYLHKDKLNRAEKYVLKALDVLKANHLFYNRKETPQAVFACDIALQKSRLGQFYSQLGKYEEALEKGFREAQFIINNEKYKCPKNLSKPYIDEGIGEIFLRQGHVKEAERLLTEADELYSKALGIYSTIVPKILRAEARVRLNKLQEAYDDCVSVWSIKKMRENNYNKLVYITSFYHAALIKYKQEDYQKSLEYFSDFIKNMQMFCKGFLDAKEYVELEKKGVFKDTEVGGNTSQNNLSPYFKRSLDIFTIIYGAEHPFTKDYILKNYNESSSKK